MGEQSHRNEAGCLFVFAIVGAELLFVGWFLGQFLLDPARCGGPGCFETMRADLNLSVISAVVGIGCIVLLACTNAFNIRIPFRQPAPAGGDGRVCHRRRRQASRRD